MTTTPQFRYTSNCQCPENTDVSIFPPLLTSFIFGAIAAISITLLLS